MGEIYYTRPPYRKRKKRLAKKLPSFCYMVHRGVVCKTLHGRAIPDHTWTVFREAIDITMKGIQVL